MVIDPAFWKGRRILVTGHTGFKGSWLALWLQSLGAYVVGFSLDPATQPNLFTEARVAAGMVSRRGDIRDRDQMLRVMRDEQPEIVLHLAAQSLVRTSYEDPVATFATNVLGTAHLLDAVRRCDSVRVAIIVTSDKCYENREWRWPYREPDRLGGRDPYSSSKACAELVAHAYRASFFSGASGSAPSAAIATVRAGNVIGGGDWATDRLVPDIIRSYLSEKAVAIRNPQAIRPWQHVLEPLAGYLLLAEQVAKTGTRFADAWNFGPDLDDSQPVSQVVETITRQWGGEARWFIDARPQPHEAGLLRLDSTKARTELGWSPRWSLREALDATVGWYKRHAAGENARELVMQDVRRYLSHPSDATAA